MVPLPETPSPLASIQFYTVEQKKVKEIERRVNEIMSCYGEHSCRQILARYLTEKVFVAMVQEPIVELYSNLDFEKAYPTLFSKIPPNSYVMGASGRFTIAPTVSREVRELLIFRQLYERNRGTLLTKIDKEDSVLRSAVIAQIRLSYSAYDCLMMLIDPSSEELRKRFIEDESVLKVVAMWLRSLSER